MLWLTYVDHWSAYIHIIGYRPPVMPYLVKPQPRGYKKAQSWADAHFKWRSCVAIMQRYYQAAVPTFQVRHLAHHTLCWCSCIDVQVCWCPHVLVAVHRTSHSIWMLNGYNEPFKYDWYQSVVAVNVWILYGLFSSYTDIKRGCKI